MLTIGLEAQYVGPTSARIIIVAWVADNVAVEKGWPGAVVGQPHGFVEVGHFLVHAQNK